ncbi:MAG: hypothetical protein HC897_03830 [Thermoanaerobaculia bacterium]|nr:hypothetical protein [Thermoanaerobaculia bacterium]
MSKQEQVVSYLDPWLVDILRRLAEGIVAVIGPFCEVVVHDFGDLEHSVVVIAGDVTGRRPGAGAEEDGGGGVSGKGMMGKGGSSGAPIYTNGGGTDKVVQAWRIPTRARSLPRMEPATAREIRALPRVAGAVDPVSMTESRPMAHGLWVPGFGYSC